MFMNIFKIGFLSSIVLLISFSSFSKSPRLFSSVEKQEKSIEEKKDEKEIINKEKNSIISHSSCNPFPKIASDSFPAVVSISSTQLPEPQEKLDSQKGFNAGTLEDLLKEFHSRMRPNPLQPRPIQSLGSGFIIQSNKTEAYIVTNYHVVADAKRVTVYLHDKTELDSIVHAYDEKTDLAVLKVSTKKLNKALPVLEWGQSDTIRVGEWVAAIGNPFGLGSTFTVGVVSCKGRDLILPDQKGFYGDDFIQHSAQINMGNSGGCLLDMNGKVIGVNMAIFSPSGGNVGIGFAIPSSVAKRIIEQLISFSKVQRNWFGIAFLPVNEKIRDSLGLEKKEGVLVNEVIIDSPAYKAGIQPGDVILEFDNKSLNRENKLSRLVREASMNTPYPIKLWRKGKILDLSVTLQELTDSILAATEATKKGTSEILGMELSVLSAEDKSTLSGNDDENIKGIYVKSVNPDSFAADAGIRRGDIIVEAQQEPVSTPLELKNIITKNEGTKDYILLRIIRAGHPPMFLAIRIKPTTSSLPEQSQKKKG